MQNFGRENFDDSMCIRQISSDFSTVKVLRYTVATVSSCCPTGCSAAAPLHAVGQQHAVVWDRPVIWDAAVWNWPVIQKILV